MILESPVTLALIAINALIGVYTLWIDPSIIGKMAFRPYAFYRNGEYWRLLTAGFVHGGIGHLAVNMITLFFFGPVIEMLLGPFGFIAVYLGSDVIANLATLARYRNDESYGAIGASGAVSGVLFSFCLFAPLDMIYIMGVLPLPAIGFAVLYVGYSIYAAKQLSDRVAHEAHLGGALGGVLITIALVPQAVLIFLEQLGL